ncbi:hypothetical protein B0H13DRAFT_2314421 [Mycena leptocephala]|nr:hypothetical protein B0H13DRAFT_2314421 [Mycena leptocephala]
MITWTSSSDPTFSIDLTHPSFVRPYTACFAFDLSSFSPRIMLLPSQIMWTQHWTKRLSGFPLFQQGGWPYILAFFVNITDIDQIFAASGDFGIAAAAGPSSTVSTASASPRLHLFLLLDRALLLSCQELPVPLQALGLCPLSVSHTYCAGLTLYRNHTQADPYIIYRTSPLLPSTTAMDSQSAALSGASSEALDTTTPRAANPLAPPFPGVVILLFLAFCTTLLAGAWVL